MKKLLVLFAITILITLMLSGCSDGNGFAKIRLNGLSGIFERLGFFSDNKDDTELNPDDKNDEKDNETKENDNEEVSEDIFDNTDVLLSLNNTGDDVKELQKLLNNIVDIEYYLIEDGNYSKKTEDAVKSFKLKYEFLKDESGDFNGNLTEKSKDTILKVIEDRKVKDPYDIKSLVDKNYFLTSDFVPNDLTTPNVRYVLNKDQTRMRKESALAIEDMFNAADKESIELYVRTGYRSYNTQKIIFDGRILKGQSPIEANKISARPGQSEHQLGLAVDVTAKSVQFGLVERFGETKEGRWIKQNAHKFGFIISYPKEKIDVTGYNYEPWHLRYVGEDAAKEIYENEFVLEEYIRVKN